MPPESVTAASRRSTFTHILPADRKLRRCWSKKKETGIVCLACSTMIIAGLRSITPKITVDKTPVESRSAWYLIDKLNELYGGKLSDLPEWRDWVKGVESLRLPVLNAFLGKENLHNFQDSIRNLAKSY